VTLSVTTKKAPHADTHDGAPASQENEGPQAAQPPVPATAAAGAGADAAMADAQASAATQAPARDEHTGRGGLYRRNPDGTRELIERTQRG